MTPEKAKEKWCPMARSFGLGGPCNRGPQGEEQGNALCIADACMAWRWHTGCMDYPYDDQSKMGDKGYCGAFGKDGAP